MLELDGLTRRYGDVVALDDLTFDVQANQVHGFVGPNGAGKTTAMRIVLGVLAQDAGEVRWDGRPIEVGRLVRAVALGPVQLGEVGELLAHTHLRVQPALLRHEAESRPRAPPA